MSACLALAYGLAWTVEGVALARGVRFTSLTGGDDGFPRIGHVCARDRGVYRRSLHHARRFRDCRAPPWSLGPYLVVWILVPLLIAGIYALTLLVALGRFDPTFAR